MGRTEEMRSKTKVVNLRPKRSTIGAETIENNQAGQTSYHHQVSH